MIYKNFLYFFLLIKDMISSLSRITPETEAPCPGLEVILAYK